VKVLRSGVVVAGALIMILGLFFLSFLGAMWTSFGDIRGGGFGLFFPQLIGLGMLGIGFILIIAGLAASPIERPRTIIRQVQERPAPPSAPSPSPAPAPTVTQVLAICPQCKARIASNSKFCPECGADLRPKQT